MNRTKLGKFEQKLEDSIESAKPISRKRKNEIFKLLDKSRVAKSASKIPKNVPDFN